MTEQQSRGWVSEISLDREKARNALDLAAVDRLIAAFAEARDNPLVRAVVLHGKGAGFCAGSDVKEMASASMEARLAVASRKACLMNMIAELDKPVICAVHGFALGGGFMLAIGCDVVVTANDALWGLPEVSLGFFPPWGIEALVRRVGTARARRLVWGGSPFAGTEAVSLGLAEEAVPGGEVLDQARRLAGQLAELPPLAVQATKRFFRENLSVPRLDALARDAYRQSFEAGSVDFARFRGATE